MFRAEWIRECSCALGQAMGNGLRPIYFADDSEAISYWLMMRSGGDNPFHAAHARGRGHLLTVHVPQVCACSDCSPEFYQ